MVDYAKVLIFHAHEAGRSVLQCQIINNIVKHVFKCHLNSGLLSLRMLCGFSLQRPHLYVPISFVFGQKSLLLIKHVINAMSAFSPPPPPC